MTEPTQGRVAIVDDEGFEWLSKWRWHYGKGKPNALRELIAEVQNRKPSGCTLQLCSILPSEKVIETWIIPMPAKTDFDLTFPNHKVGLNSETRLGEFNA